MVSATRLSEDIKCKKDLYAGAVRNQILVPTQASRLCTVDFLIGLKNCDIWFVRGEDIKGF
jgi:hypothetical protein